MGQLHIAVLVVILLGIHQRSNRRRSGYHAFVLIGLGAVLMER